MVGARGTTEMQGTSMAYTPMAKKVLAAVPGGEIYDIKYSSSAEYVMTPKQGASSGLQYIKGQIAKCPKTVFVLMGYSKGAMVQTQILASKDLPPNKVVAAVLFGNPYYQGGLPQNKCAAKTGKGIAAAMMVRIPPQYVSIVFDCCLPMDMICQTMGQMMTHLTYGGKSASDAQAFVVSKLKAAISGGGGSSSGGPGGNKASVGTGDQSSAKTPGGLGGGGMGGMPGGGMGGKPSGGLGSMLGGMGGMPGGGMGSKLGGMGSKFGGM
ncbi:hypothetical protein PCANC_24456 [Puccinia coronata f. sp. avenae]|uniref:Cutinase n=2 Tax=Puccinia coronata f. sp. avenae TaxID=200324 RepID=A0A2N5V2E6_9BASI|nr:hypothetical protein PCANC_24456 [Puccinia coronata f. sp. avenae]PLW22680.1 hypothetical protein PCASD_12831 [Puccinia coronata f. sp. avenae]PLW44097.1 hypothetical protein PCASD_04824 [Puccinia coronata f. sp. avenae]